MPLNLKLFHRTWNNQKQNGDLSRPPSGNTFIPEPSSVPVCEEPLNPKDFGSGNTFTPEPSVFKNPFQETIQTLPRDFLIFNTCLRSIVITEVESTKKSSCFQDFDYYQGRDAYRFLLEVICGLHSPMIGETEVFGQFKDFIFKNKNNLSLEINYIFNQLLQEGKKIRKDFLQNLGCISYGSLLRRHLRSTDQDIHIIGAGSLSRDILPFLTKLKRKIHVYTRNPENHRSLKEKYETVSLKPLSSLKHQPPEVHGVLTLAAPLSSHWFFENIKAKAFEKIYDLRGESRTDPLPFSNVISLGSLFSQIKKNRDQVESVKKRVLPFIKDRAMKVNPMEKQYPFGWEDLWTCS